VQEKAVSYVDQIKDQINEIKGEIQQLDSNFRQEKIDDDEYLQKRQSLKHIKDSLKEECSRMGVIPP
jgi:regulator of sigma D